MASRRRSTERKQRWERKARALRIIDGGIAGHSNLHNGEPMFLPDFNEGWILFTMR
jgi:hypothetical protein